MDTDFAPVFWKCSECGATTEDAMCPNCDTTPLLPNSGVLTLAQFLARPLPHVVAGRRAA